MYNFVPILRGNGTKIAPTGEIFDQPPGGMSWIRGKLANHVGDHVVLSPEEGVLVTSPGTESSYPRLPQSLNNSRGFLVIVVVSHIQRIGCQPEKITLHGGQSRSWSAEHGKENKRRSLAAYPPPPARSENNKK